MGRSGYTSLSLEEKQYTRIRKKFDRHYDGDQKFTPYVTGLIEDALDRLAYLNDNFPTITVVKVIENGLLIEDSRRKDDVIKVALQGKKIVCSDDKDPQRYITYATLHPEF